jgi:hypothetical protein
VVRLEVGDALGVLSMEVGDRVHGRLISLPRSPPGGLVAFESAVANVFALHAELATEPESRQTVARRPGPADGLNAL